MKVIETLPQSPGVYRMLSPSNDVLYVGKAKNLKKRVIAYSRPDTLPLRLQRMVAETSRMEIVTTHTEAEALLLEANLIKQLEPRYNILLRDGKGLSYILFTDHAYPLLAKVRGTRQGQGQHFGPFASTEAVWHTINSLYRVFKLRSCADGVFANRTRPCLQYHIKRCSAPCVGYISKEDYRVSVKQAQDFLEGKSHMVQKQLSAEMSEAAELQLYEKAAEYRNRLQALAKIQATQTINTAELDSTDVIAAAQIAGKICIQVFFFRNGCNFGSHAFFPRHSPEDSIPTVLGAFMGQFYAGMTPPPQFLFSELPEDAEVLRQALSNCDKKSVEFLVPKRGLKARVVAHALENAQEALARMLADKASQRILLSGLQRAFDLSKMPERIEVYDNSHISGKYPYGVMIVYGKDGFLKQAYRKFSIQDTTLSPGDDFGMMREVMSRRFRKGNESENLPDLILIDGGQGQLSTVWEILDSVGLHDLKVVAIAKGPDRNAGREQFFMKGRLSFQMPFNDPVLYLLQRLRDEAHRFAITTHRKSRIKGLQASSLDSIPGIGPGRKKALLKHFGSARGIEQAGVKDLQIVEGINQKIAQAIYDHFHPV